jgi:hypothetical protein
LAKLEPVQKEFESFLLNNRALREDDREAAKALIDENASPAAMLEVLPSIVQTGSERLSEADAAYARATNGKHIPNLITPQAAAILKKLGIESPAQTGGVGGGGNSTRPLPDFKSQGGAGGAMQSGGRTFDDIKKQAGIP